MITKTVFFIKCLLAGGLFGTLFVLSWIIDRFDNPIALILYVVILGYVLFRRGVCFAISTVDTFALRATGGDTEHSEENDEEGFRGWLFSLLVSALFFIFDLDGLFFNDEFPPDMKIWCFGVLFSILMAGESTLDLIWMFIKRTLKRIDEKNSKQTMAFSEEELMHTNDDYDESEEIHRIHTECRRIKE